MMHGRHAVAVLLAVLAGAPDAAAQFFDHPRSLPTRDVAVVYRLNGDDMSARTRKLRVTYDVVSGRTRLDYFRWDEAKYPFAAVIVDRPAKTTTTVMPESRSYVQRPFDGSSIPGELSVADDTRFDNAGTQTIADTDCIDWHMRSAKGEDRGNVCVTDDGVMLRMMPPGATEPSVIATALLYGAAPDTVFAPPADFQNRSEK